MTTDKPQINPNFRWTANAAGQMTREAQQVLRGIIDTLFSRTGEATSNLVTGTAGTTNNLAKWNADGDLVDGGSSDIITRWTAASASGPASLDFREDSDNGTSRVRLAAPSSLAADRTVTFPDATGTVLLSSDLGVTVQGYDALLASIAGLTVAAGGFIRTTAADTAVAQAIVGTVSQSGGTPTGAIMEYGSNANGDYVRFANGVQVCWASGLDAGSNPTTASGGIFIDTATQATFAATFSTGPQTIVSFSKRSSGSGVGWTAQGAGTNASTTQTFPIIRAASTSGWTGSWGFIAIGRWFN